MTIPSFLLGRRAALTALTLCTAGVGALAVLGVMAIVGDTGMSVPDKIRQLALLNAEAAARPQVQSALAALRQQAATHPSLLRGESDALAQAALQSSLKALVEANGGEVRSAFSLPTEAENGLALISVQYDITVPVTKVRPLAYGIESQLPYLFLSGIDISAPQAWPADPKMPEPRVEVRWTVSGYRWSGLPGAGP